MSIATLVRSLAAAGATIEMIAIAVEAVEAEQAKAMADLEGALEAEQAKASARVEAKRSGNAERQRRLRQRRGVTPRNALHCVTERDVTRDERDPSPLDDPQPSLPYVEDTLQTSPKEKDTSYPKRKGSHRWPEGSFERIWAAYPNKVGKKVAFAKLARMERDAEASPDEILAGIERYKLDKPEHHEWKHPLTWLNAGCWSDEYASPVATGPPVNGFQRPPVDLRAEADAILAAIEKGKSQNGQRH